jgi:aspartyl-tRNA(Asn)/glutamyl-tRNA(Gln) amidotransferase subunit C
MKISKKDIRYVAYLSRIALTDNEEELFVHQLSDILSYIEKLNKLNTDNVDPLVYTTNTFNVFREDALEKSISIEDAHYCAPSTMGVFFKVPKVIE